MGTPGGGGLRDPKCPARWGQEDAGGEGLRGVVPGGDIWEGGVWEGGLWGRREGSG